MHWRFKEKENNFGTVKYSQVYNYISVYVDTKNLCHGYGSWQVDKASQTCSAILNQLVEAITSFILSSAWNMSCCHLVETVSPIDRTASLL